MLRASEAPRFRDSEIPSCRTADGDRRPATGNRRTAEGDRRSSLVARCWSLVPRGARGEMRAAACVNFCYAYLTLLTFPSVFVTAFRVHTSWLASWLCGFTSYVSSYICLTHTLITYVGWLSGCSSYDSSSICLACLI